ncbi:MAG TPA: ABC transporter ATP-binding protein [Sutterella sp.]|nr:ABC transporter ATP-binding protein [Sutterella sp.]
MLVVKNLHKTFFAGTANEKKALQGIDLTLEDGDFVTVIGSNGAGKSTLLNAIAGVFPVDEGTIEIDGIDLTHMKEHARAKYIGRVFQDPMRGTAANMMISENLAMASRRGQKQGLVWSEKADQMEEFKQMLASLNLGLENRMTTHVGMLSGGQRQAITLLMATLVRPKLLLLDEHTAALDPKTASKVLEQTRQIVTDNHLTTLMITHNMRDAITFGTRLIMMHDGRIVVDIKGEEKQKLTVADLLELFEKRTGNVSDNAVLG